MQHFPLSVSAIMRHGCGVHGKRRVSTALGDNRYAHKTYREVGQDAGRLANALRRLGVAGDQRIGTFMWNNAEHLVAYLGVPSMGAVLHTLNIRLSPSRSLSSRIRLKIKWFWSMCRWRRCSLRCSTI